MLNQKGAASAYNISNTGTVKVTGKSSQDVFGGILGYLNGSMNNCYNLGELSSTNGIEFGGITGAAETGSIISNAYYNSKTTTKGVVVTPGTITNSSLGKTDSEIKSQNFINILNNNIDSITNVVGLKQWKLGTKGYPVL